MEDHKSPLSIRRNYISNEGHEFEPTQDPASLLVQWQTLALSAGNLEPNGMILSTVSDFGKPSSRVVLLREILEGQLVFYTNYESRKGIEIQESGLVCAVFWWPEINRQVRVEGRCVKASSDISDVYFASRPIESQLASSTSPQSQTIMDLSSIEIEMARLRESVEIKRPTHWGGFLIIPERFEFWLGQPARLHKRHLATLLGNSWQWSVLAP